MAEQDDSEKTEEPTQKKLDDARKKGDVAKSQEVSGFTVLAAGAALTALASGFIANGVSADVRGYLAHLHAIPLDGPAVMQLAVDVAVTTIKGLVLVGVVLVVAAFAGHVLQAGFVFSTEKIQPKLSKLSPVQGFGRVFGKAAAANFGKGLLKLVFVSAAGTLAIWPMMDALPASVWLDASAILPMAGDITAVFLAAALAVYVLIAVIDFVGQRQSFMKRQRMSLRDIKDEHKQSEGDPIVKARLRAIRQERSRKRTMAAVPDATVLVTNPTHYAVALKYEDGSRAAPVCTAKGVDHLALAMRRVAEEHDVPVVEDAPLARALYAGAEIDRPIPERYYQAVAKIIGYVLTIAARASR